MLPPSAIIQKGGFSMTEHEKYQEHIRHAQSLTPEQLAVIIQMAQAAVPNPENLKLDEKETEDME